MTTNEVINYDSKSKSYIIKNCNLKILSVINSEIFYNLLCLDVSDNSLKYLPSQDCLPVLKQLRCGSNMITSIPFYSQLDLLYAPRNFIKSLKNYDKSNLTYLDCSYNRNIDVDICLPHCTELYVSHTNILSIKLSKFPQIKLLDCSSNRIQSISKCNTLIELDVSNNNLQDLPQMDYLVRLFADNNNIKNLNVYNNLVYLSISNNLLQILVCNNNLEYLNASCNRLTKIDGHVNVETIDVSDNFLKQFLFYEKMVSVYIYSNNITQTNLPVNLENILEMQIDLFLYSLFDSKSINSFESETMILNKESLSKNLTTYYPNINKNVIELLSKLKYINNTNRLFKIFCKAYGKQVDYRELVHIYYKNVYVLVAK